MSVSEEVQYFVSRTRRAYSDRKKDETVRLLVEVQSGIVSGAQSVVELSEISIGSDAQSQILLLDDGIDPTHVKIHATRDLFGTKFIVTAIGKDVVLFPYGGLEIGEVRVVRSQLKLNINGVKLTVEPSDRELSPAAATPAVLLALNDDEVIGGLPVIVPQPRATDPAPNRVSTGRFFLTMILGAATLAGGLWLLSSGNYLAKPLLFAKKAPEIVTPKNDGDSGGIAVLTKRIEQKGLGAYVTVAARADGALLASGSLPRDQASVWRSVLEWYDGHANSPQLRTDVKFVDKKPSPPSISSVSFGAKPHVILANGDMLEVGDQTSNGWKLRKIDNGGIELAHGQLITRIKF